MAETPARMVTYDLRGHGNSDKPLDPARYRDSKAWGDEVKAVMDAAGLRRPVLVGWSYAGRVISDYVTTHGAGRLAGINFVDASIKFFPEFVGDNLKNLPIMTRESPHILDGRNSAMIGNAIRMIRRRMSVMMNGITP